MKVGTSAPAFLLKYDIFGRSHLFDMGIMY